MKQQAGCIGVVASLALLVAVIYLADLAARAFVSSRLALFFLRPVLVFGIGFGVLFLTAVIRRRGKRPE